MILPISFSPISDAPFWFVFALFASLRELALMVSSRQDHQGYPFPEGPSIPLSISSWRFWRLGAKIGFGYGRRPRWLIRAIRGGEAFLVFSRRFLRHTT